jgi:hypothetical protein
MGSGNPKSKKLAIGNHKSAIGNRQSRFSYNGRTAIIPEGS